MKSYPSIPGSSKVEHAFCYAFNKIDGSSMRYEWTKKNGFYKFGSRTQLIDETSEVLGKSIPIFLQKYGDDLHKIFCAEKLFRGAQSITVYGEFFGEGSFAGQHLPDKQQDVIIFDINVHKKGMISPKEFLDHVGHLAVAELIYTGNLNHEFIENIRTGKIDLISKYPIKQRIPEGVVAKIGSGHHLKMFKIKTDAYRDELKKVYSESWQSFWE